MVNEDASGSRIRAEGGHGDFKRVTAGADAAGGVDIGIAAADGDICRAGVAIGDGAGGGKCERTVRAELQTGNGGVPAAEGHVIGLTAEVEGVGVHVTRAIRPADIDGGRGDVSELGRREVKAAGRSAEIDRGADRCGGKGHIARAGVDGGKVNIRTGDADIRVHGGQGVIEVYIRARNKREVGSAGRHDSTGGGVHGDVAAGSGDIDATVDSINFGNGRIGIAVDINRAVLSGNAGCAGHGERAGRGALAGIEGDAIRAESGDVGAQEDAFSGIQSDLTTAVNDIRTDVQIRISIRSGGIKKHRATGRVDPGDVSNRGSNGDDIQSIRGVGDIDAARAAVHHGHGIDSRIKVDSAAGQDTERAHAGQVGAVVVIHSPPGQQDESIDVRQSHGLQVDISAVGTAELQCTGRKPAQFRITEIERAGDAPQTNSV